MAKIGFEWSYSDANHPSVFFRLYENQKMVVDNIAVMNFSLLMDGKAEGTYVYNATTVDKTTLLESVPSNTLTINFSKPAAPTGFKGSWAQ